VIEASAKIRIADTRTQLLALARQNGAMLPTAKDIGTKSAVPRPAKVQTNRFSKIKAGRAKLADRRDVDAIDQIAAARTPMQKIESKRQP
jgi:hypothetical protein